MLKTKKRRINIAVNAGSMADIAFLLLIFFLVTTTIDVDKGILVKLPPFDFYPPQELPDKNVLSVKINASNELLVEGELLAIGAVKSKAKEFILNPLGLKRLPEKPSNAIISLQNDRGTSYETYLNVYNELRATYNEIWAEKSLDIYGKPYDKLGKLDKKALKKVIPLVISESEPTFFEQKK